MYAMNVVRGMYFTIKEQSNTSLFWIKIVALALLIIAVELFVIINHINRPIPVEVVDGSVHVYGSVDVDNVVDVTGSVDVM